MAQATKKRKTRGASRPTQQKKHPLPPWLWLLSGMLIGAGIMSVLPLGEHTTGHSSSETATHAPSPKSKDEPSTAHSSPKPVFDFYTELSRNASPESKENQSSNNHKNTVQKGAKEYMLQVGVFRRTTEADQLRARLLLDGLSASVTVIKAPSGQQWFRVQVGPFKDKSALQSTQKQLQAKGIHSLILKIDA